MLEDVSCLRYLRPHAQTGHATWAWAWHATCRKMRRVSTRCSTLGQTGPSIRVAALKVSRTVCTAVASGNTHQQTVNMPLRARRTWSCCKPTTHGPISDTDPRRCGDWGDMPNGLGVSAVAYVSHIRRVDVMLPTSLPNVMVRKAQCTFPIKENQCPDALVPLLSTCAGYTMRECPGPHPTTEAWRMRRLRRP